MWNDGAPVAMTANTLNVSSVSFVRDPQSVIHRRLIDLYCVQSPQYSSGGSFDGVKVDLSAEDLSIGRHGSQVAPDDDDDDHDDHDDNDKINDTEGVDPERLKAFNVSRYELF